MRAKNHGSRRQRIQGETYLPGRVLVSGAIRSDKIQVANDGHHAWAMLWMADGTCVQRERGGWSPHPVCGRDGTLGNLQ
ncbi:BQ5605_C002g01755 [Microbotryum silenes-dioicae]|uniref:BQ5605_C002g01755 protein n=1 Tax=Microbotryum silenes-dioicae TaxID=796604 RepID=A0A2X0MLM0_9BASI|nr:BQ5605_C002g01755 [Microbotryum silenes-dioicae]